MHENSGTTGKATFLLGGKRLKVGQLQFFAVNMRICDMKGLTNAFNHNGCQRLRKGRSAFSF